MILCYEMYYSQLYVITQKYCGYYVLIYADTTRPHCKDNEALMLHVQDMQEKSSILFVELECQDRLL